MLFIHSTNMGDNKREYEDILSYRRKEISHFVWAYREINPKLAVHGQDRCSPSCHKKAVLDSLKISDLINKLSKSTNIPEEELRTQVKKILDEIGYKRNLNIIRSLGVVLTKICLKVCNRIYVNFRGISQLNASMGHCPVIFVPTHRSYADFIMFSYICFTYDIAIPAIAAGMDFQGMLGMGEMLRNTGAFYLRRTYNDDTLYWITFKQYVYQLVTKGNLPIEFFIEGTRSRSNKSLVPKYGFINMILKAFFFSEVPDILFVPVSICYDRILEESLFAFELLGIPKPKETTSGFFKSLKILKENFGNIYFHVDDPISAREILGDKVDRSVHNLSPLYQQEITNEEKRLIPPLAYEIVRRQQKSSVITAFNLIATILNDNLSSGNESIASEVLAIEFEYLSGVLKAWGAYIFEQDFKSGLEECLVVHQNLINCQPNGDIFLVKNQFVVDKLNPSKLKGHSFCQEVLNYSVPFIMLQIYCNPVLHYLIDVAFIVIILKNTSNLDQDQLFQHFSFLKSLFSNEFVSFSDWQSKDFDKALEHSLTENLILIKNGAYAIGENEKLESILLNSVRPFILAYSVMMGLLKNGPEFCDEKKLLINAQEFLEDIISQKKVFIHPYCLSLDTLSNCLNGLCTIGILKKSKKNNVTVFQIDHLQVEMVRNKLAIYIPKLCMEIGIDKYIRSKL